MTLLCFPGGIRRKLGSGFLGFEVVGVYARLTAEVRHLTNDVQTTRDSSIRNSSRTGRPIIFYAYLCKKKGMQFMHINQD